MEIKMFVFFSLKMACSPPVVYSQAGGKFIINLFGVNINNSITGLSEENI
jgi:hypothetical protein